MKKQIQLFKTTNKKTPIGSVCTVATEMKTSAKRQKVNALNKSLIKHDEGINNTQLFLISLQDMIIFRDWTQNLIDGPLQAWKEWILNRTYLLVGGRHFEIIRFPSVLCRPIQKRNPRQSPASPANGPRSLLFVSNVVEHPAHWGKDDH